MTDDIVTRLTISGDHSPSQCWGCGEWGCKNSKGEYVPCWCEGDDTCSHDNDCDCNCHEWGGIVNDAKAEIERLRERLYWWREVADALHYDMCIAGGKPVLDGERLYREARAEWDQMEKEAANG